VGRQILRAREVAHMMTDREYVSAEISLKAVRLEEELSDALTRTAEEIAHAECLDEEQRAEVYTILETLRSDTHTHRKVVGMWVANPPAGGANA
jgi:hypothetical protein